MHAWALYTKHTHTHSAGFPPRNQARCKAYTQHASEPGWLLTTIQILTMRDAESRDIIPVIWACLYLGTARNKPVNTGTISTPGYQLLRRLWLRKVLVDFRGNERNYCSVYINFRYFFFNFSEGNDDKFNTNHKCPHCRLQNNSFFGISGHTLHKARSCSMWKGQLEACCDSKMTIMVMGCSSVLWLSNISTRHNC